MDVQKVVGWYATHCQVGRAAASGEVAGLDEVEGRKLHWYCVMALTVVGTSVLAFVVMV